ncbi:alpha/beta hydrolase [Emticicia sp.]|uniref:alpha/beta hydrolase n=1 Tax=Emticicia sp. TaxID=1930953 RepID=UPI0037503E58
MKIKHSFLFTLLLVVFKSKSIYAQGFPKVKESTVPSTILKKDVKLIVRLPESYETSKKTYPVLYFLNGMDKTVEEVSTMSQKLQGDKNTSEMIVVGIDIKDENIDRMPDKAHSDKILSYFEKELIPAITKKYRVNGQKILYGKSLSGSLTLYAFLNKPTLFNGYIAASKQWYEKNNDYFTALAKKSLQNPENFKSRKIFLATLNGAYNNNNIPEVDNQMTAFSKLLMSKSGNKISAKYQAFDDWGIEPQPSFNNGLLFVSPKPKTASLTMTQNTNGKWVIMDSKKTTLYEVFPYDNGPDSPSEGLIRVVKNGKIGYADAKTYTIVITPQFDCAFPFENGKAKVSNQCKTIKDGEHSIWTSDAWQYVDKKGKF